MAMMSRIPGFCAVAGPLIALSLTLVAISRSPWFSWTGNYLSDLGANQDAVAALFNSGLIIGGALIAILGIGLKEALPGLRGSMGAIALVLGAVAVCCVGIFPVTAGVIHDCASGSCFGLAIIALLLIGSAMMQEPSGRNLGLFIFITGWLTAIAGIALGVIELFPRAGGAIPEFIIALGASISLIALGVGC